MKNYKIWWLVCALILPSLAKAQTNPSPTNLNETVTGTFTGSTSVLNIGSGQIYKDTSGNVGFGTTTPGTIPTSGDGQFEYAHGTNSLGTDNYIGIYSGTYGHVLYGISETLPSPSGTVTLGGYYSGLGISGLTANSNTPIFGLLSSGQSNSGVGNDEFTVYDNHKITTYHSYLDDGSGNMSISGSITSNGFTNSSGAASFSGGTFGGSAVNTYLATRSSYQSASQSKTAPASTSAYKMQGLAGAITPTLTGSVLITINGTITAPTGTTVNNGILYQISYGTGTAPANAATLVGTQVGPIEEYTSAVAPTAAGDVHVPFSVTAVVSLTVGTTYWIDLAAESVTTASAMGLSNVAITATEQ